MLAATCTPVLLDVHTDEFHNRSVFTLAGDEVQEYARNLTLKAVELLDIRKHAGVHPRMGIVDVVPFIPLPGSDSSMHDACTAQNAFAQWAASELHIPAFLYGASRSLPEVRKGAFHAFPPDFGPPAPHTTAGAIAVGCRSILIAYNLWLDTDDTGTARAIAKSIRQEGLRTLGLDVGGVAQVSCNLTDPQLVGPELAYDLVAAQAPIRRAELVGLLPRGVLHRQDTSRWEQLDLSEQKTIEARLSGKRTQVHEPKETDLQ